MGTPARRGGIHAAALIRPASQSIACHCERSEAIQNLADESVWIASSQELLAKTTESFSYDLLLPATAATGAGVSCFWNINNGRKMTRP